MGLRLPVEEPSAGLWGELPLWSAFVTWRAVRGALRVRLCDWATRLLYVRSTLCTLCSPILVMSRLRLGLGMWVATFRCRDSATTGRWARAMVAAPLKDWAPCPHNSLLSHTQQLHSWKGYTQGIAS